MDIIVQTGHTKSESGIKLISMTRESAVGESVLFLLQIEADTAEAKTVEKECETIIEHALLDTEGDAAARLDGTLKEINGFLKGLMLSRTVGDVNAIIALVEKGGALHVSHAGRAEAYVIRGGVASQITEYSKGKPTPAFVHIASGDLYPRDAVVCSTQRLLRTLTPAQLSQLSQRGDQMMEEIIVALDAEKERASLGIFHVGGTATVAPARERASAGSDRRTRAQEGGKRSLSMPKMSLPSISLPKMGFSTEWAGSFKETAGSFMRDLSHPQRKRRAHLLLLAGTLAAFLAIWMMLNLFTFSQRSQSKAELEQLMTQITEEVQRAENRHLTGDIDSANAILQRAEERAKQVMDNESGLFRMEALDLLDRIRAKREGINNIVRLSPRIVVNISAKNPDVLAQGFIGLADGEFLVYDKQDLYRVLLNSIDDADRLSDSELIVSGVNFPRYQTMLFQTTGNSMIEMISDQPTSMKTEDPAGWITGKDMETYLRFLYVLSPENNQIYKYERLANRYSAPAQYNVDGDLSNALDMAIDGNVFVLKEGGEVVKLFRGEAQPFVVRYAPDDALKNATKMYKNPEGGFYFLDPVGARVIMVTGGGATGESSYVRQFVLEGEEIGTLKDLYVDPDETRLYVMDEKRVYVVDLKK